MLSLKKIYLFFCAVLLACTFCRTFLLLFLTDIKTGFLLPDLKAVSVGLIAFIVFSLLVLAVFSYLCEAKPKSSKIPSLYTAVSSIVLGVGLAIDVFSSAFAGGGIFWQSALKTVFGLLSAVVFILYGTSRFTKVKFSKMYFSAVILFLVFQTVEVFTFYSTLAVIYDHVFDILILCLLLVFFLCYARVQNGIVLKNNRILLSIGFLTACVCAAYQLSNYICVISGGQEAIHSQNPLGISLLFAAVFIMFTLNDMCLREKC